MRLTAVGVGEGAVEPEFARPTGVWPYYDLVQVWLRRSADRPTIMRLRRHCGDLHPDDRPAPFGQGYRQRLEFKQPRDGALRWIAMRNDALVNRVEVALDITFDNPVDRDDAIEFLHRYLVRRWHGRRQEVRVVGHRGGRPDEADGIGGRQTRYDGPRGAPNLMVLYASEYSRITGEPNCLHLEWRASGLRAVKSAGIRSGRDPLKFDHRAFWQERLLLRNIDPERLGRLIQNRNDGTRRRTPKRIRFGRGSLNLDARTGECWLHGFWTIQELIDEARSLVRVERALVPIDPEPFLPPARTQVSR